MNVFSNKTCINLQRDRLYVPNIKCCLAVRHDTTIYTVYSRVAALEISFKVSSNETVYFMPHLD